MARPRSEDKRSAIMAAAIRAIASRGPGAPTATIAKEAGVSNGSLFTYFETKADLLNQLYREIKGDMAAAALDGTPDRERHPRAGAVHVVTPASLGHDVPREAPDACASRRVGRHHARKAIRPRAKRWLA